MITTYVPKGTPLTIADHAISVYVVLNDDADVVGVYPSLQRTVEYITNWMNVAELGIPTLENVNDFTWRFGIWTIQASNYRF